MSIEIVRVADKEAVAAHSAEVVAAVCNATSRTVHVALAGGTTPERCHELLAPLVSDWGHVHLWLSDERAVGPDDDDSNFKMVRRSLLDGIQIPAGNVHRVLGERGADDAAALYQAEVLDAVVAGADGLPLFDVIMCGMGPDGHTCSLFPGHPEIHVDDRLVVGLHDSPKPPPDRITFTLPLLHAAKRLMLLVAGEEKRDAMAKVAAGPDPAVPASMLSLGALEVVVDGAAAP
ncbi:6-phosphogluconolactonase [Capillimicrobium parvum]|uniref:6-phosphogluconolactonase n=1 Tax=Capillimicrobium parvum TaxID=2884022 RepID=A0A9E7BZ55_9ACTN|nr:6-phosphogluconolactonase [Capillimicrobium parvum]UGS34966.1 Glucosamine-6-phosphate deaminase [Capillimicrobium parvum]